MWRIGRRIRQSVGKIIWHKSGPQIMICPTHCLSPDLLSNPSWILQSFIQSFVQFLSSDHLSCNPGGYSITLWVCEPQKFHARSPFWMPYDRGGTADSARTTKFRAADADLARTRLLKILKHKYLMFFYVLRMRVSPQNAVMQVTLSLQIGFFKFNKVFSE